MCPLVVVMVGGVSDGWCSFGWWAGVAELVDAMDSKSVPFGGAGSSPAAGMGVWCDEA